MSLFSILQLSGRALQAQQTGIAVTANNIANAGTDGYHRQAVDLRTAGSSWSSGLLLGEGVTAAEVSSAFDRITEERLYGEHGNQAYAEEMAAAYDVLQSQLANLDDGALAARLSDLFVAFDEMATYPGDESIRWSVLGAAEGLASEMQRQASALGSMESAANESIRLTVASADGLLERIADLNGEIVASEAGGHNANDLRDERGRLVDELAGLLDVTTEEQDDGSLTVLLAGHAAVQGTRARTLATAEDAAGDHAIVLEGTSASIDLTAQLTTGALAAHVQVRDQVVPALMADLDQLAYDVSTSINALHATGYDLDGNTGALLFAEPTDVGGAAAAMAVSSDVDDQPRALAAASGPAYVAGDGTLAIALGDLADELLAGSGTQTFNEAAAEFVGRLAADTAGAEAELSAQSAVTAAIESTWYGRSSVAMEEEAVNLVRFQDAYDAMARVLQTTQEMLDTLMGIA